VGAGAAAGREKRGDESERLTCGLDGGLGGVARLLELLVVVLVVLRRGWVCEQASKWADERARAVGGAAPPDASDASDADGAAPR
jgi:hypothetical protein